MNSIICIYLWAAFWTALLAGRDSTLPKNYIVRVFAAMILGVMWPAALPMHVYDLVASDTDAAP